jgi:mycothiol synthase
MLMRPSCQLTGRPHTLGVRAKRLPQPLPRWQPAGMSQTVASFAARPDALPDVLSSRFRLAPVQASDAADLLHLVSDCDTAVLGYPDWSLADVEADTGPLPDGSERAQALVREEATGRVVCWWWTDPHEGRAAFSADVYTEVTLPPADGDALALAGWAAIEAEARRWASASGVPGAFLDVGSLHGDAAVERRLVAAGFTQVRTFWRMGGPVPPEAAPAPEVSRLVIRPATDTHLVHELYEASFAGHWGHEGASHDAWLARVSRRVGHDPSLWSVAEVDGVPAGLLLCSRQMAQEDALYVATLGTLAPYRRRGIGAALLHHAFAVARQEGYGQVRLGVDSDNPTGAPGVYRRAGLDLLFAMHAWRKDLTGPSPASVSAAPSGP